MKFYSITDRGLTTDFQTALLTSLAPDGGLYMPERIPRFSVQEIQALAGQDFPALAATIMGKFVDGEIPVNDLKALCEAAYDFDVRLKPLADDQYVLELFHGPTLAFKDVAARCMAQCANYFLEQKDEKRTVLVATSGDTGGAVGHAFLGLPRVEVFILYPRGRVSHVQEQQLTTMGGNVTALEIEGNFDDCQRLVKEAFGEKDLQKVRPLMSANSINVGRVLPQCLYYFWASLQLQQKFPDKMQIFSVPSGNFGNLFGGLLAKRMGAPIDQFIAANNENHPFFDYLESGTFTPQPSVQTLSSAMDIGHPNNFYRIKHLYEGDVERIRGDIKGAYFSDEETANHIREVEDRYNYLLCPHTSVGHLGVEKFRSQMPDKSMLWVTAATAHPAKFLASMESIVGHSIGVPAPLQKVLQAPKLSHVLPADLAALSDFLMQ